MINKESIKNTMLTTKLQKSHTKKSSEKLKDNQHHDAIQESINNIKSALGPLTKSNGVNTGRRMMVLPVRWRNFLEMLILFVGG